MRVVVHRIEVERVLRALEPRLRGLADADGAWRRLSLFPGEYVVSGLDQSWKVKVRGGQTTELDVRRVARCQAPTR